MITLPNDLQAAIVRVLAAVKPAQWIGAAQRLSEQYRAGVGPPRITTPIHALGYAALLLPATYAQLRGAMTATAARIPDWAPRTMLDLGSGPGTALWAATTQWPSLQSLVAWEREPVLIRLGRDLAQGSVIAPIRSARWQRVDVTNPPLADQRYDLVLAGHLLNELDPAAQHALVDWAWEHTAGVLLLVEPGTSVAFPFVLAARDHLRERGAYTIAPCTHDHPCPLQNDWCHFPQRIMRPAFQRRARDAPSPWEESKFAYAAMARFPPTQAAWGRVIREPSSNKAYAEAMISTAAGVQRYRALKRHRDAYRLVRNVTWGALLETRLGDQSIEALEG